MLLVWISVGCKKKPSVPAPEPAEKPAKAKDQATPQETVPADSIIQRFILVETEGREKEQAEKEWELMAAVAYREGEERFRLEDVTLRFYSQNIEVGSLTGRTGAYDRRKEEGILTDGVVGHSREGYQLELQSIQWKKKDEEITSDDPVRITFGGSVIQGRGIVASLNLMQCMTRGVKGRVVIHEK